MNAKKIWANFTVADLERTYRFYTALGFEPNDPHRSADLTSFFFGDDKFVIHFFRKEVMEKNINISMAGAGQDSEIIFTLSAGSVEEVKSWPVVVQMAGGSIFMPPQEIGQGYTCGFADPDGHKFNVLYWPG